MWMRDVISITKPLLFIAENVKGLTNLQNVKEIIEKDFTCGIQLEKNIFLLVSLLIILI